MTSEQIWEHEVTCHPEDIQQRGPNRSPEYRVYLPDTIKKIGLGKGDHVAIEKDTSKGETYPHEVEYLVGEGPVDTSHSDEQKIYTDGSSRLRITLSSKWHEDFIDYGGDEILIVEVNTIEDQFRIYKNDEYRYRRRELNNNDIDPRTGQRVIVPASAYLAGTEMTDSSSATHTISDESVDEGTDKELREKFGDNIEDEGQPSENDSESPWTIKEATNSNPSDNKSSD